MLLFEMYRYYKRLSQDSSAEDNGYILTRSNRACSFAAALGMSMRSVRYSLYVLELSLLLRMSILYLSFRLNYRTSLIIASHFVSPQCIVVRHRGAYHHQTRLTEVASAYTLLEASCSIGVTHCWKRPSVLAAGQDCVDDSLWPPQGGTVECKIMQDDVVRSYHTSPYIATVLPVVFQEFTGNGRSVECGVQSSCLHQQPKNNGASHSCTCTQSKLCVCESCVHHSPETCWVSSPKVKTTRRLLG